MKKFSLIFIILIIIALFAGADFYLNNLKEQVVAKTPPVPLISPDAVATEFADAAFKLNEDVLGYKVINQKQASQIFEKIDLSNIKNIKIYLDRLEKAAAGNQALSAEDAQDELKAVTGSDVKNQSIYLYEIHGPLGQGSLTYLNIKLEFIRQINATTEVLNETGGLGQNSFFFNDQAFENVAFLLTQVGDNLYAFQYNKQDPAIYDDVKAIIAKILPGKISDIKTTNP